MNLWKIAWRSIQQRALSSFLTGLSIALGVALVVIVLVIHGVVSESFNQAARGYHLILGAKGGKLQLTLNTVFHLSQPIENIPYDFYKEFTIYKDESGELVRGRHKAFADVAVPYCLGDSYKDFRVVATTPDLFNKLSYGAEPDGTEKRYQFSQGKNFEHEDFHGAVIGAVAANKTGLKLGDHFPITHGVVEDENSHVHDKDAFHVVGILAPTGTPNDRAVFINMEGFFLVGEHAKPLPDKDESETGDLPAHVDQLRSVRKELNRAANTSNLSADAAMSIQRAKEMVDAAIGPDGDGTDKDNDVTDENDDVVHIENHGETGETDDNQSEHHEEHEDSDRAADHHDGGQRTPLPENQREVTAILVLCPNDMYSQLLENQINEGNVAQAVYPGREVANLFAGIVGHVQTILLVLAVLVVLVAGVGVMVSIYNSMSDRSREIGIMRALGAGRFKVMSIILIEAVLLALIGGIAGVILGHGSIGVMSPFIAANTGVAIDFWQPAPAMDLLATLRMLLIGSGAVMLIGYAFAICWIAFKDGFGWFLLGFFLSIIYVVLKWEKSKLAFLFGCVGFILMWTGILVQPVFAVMVSPELVLIPALILLAIVVGYLPAASAYRTDVARALSNSP